MKTCRRSKICCSQFRYPVKVGVHACQTVFRHLRRATIREGLVTVRHERRTGLDSKKKKMNILCKNATVEIRIISEEYKQLKTVCKMAYTILSYQPVFIDLSHFPCSNRLCYNQGSEFVVPEKSELLHLQIYSVENSKANVVMRLFAFVGNVCSRDSK